MRDQIERFKGYPQVNEFRIEALEMTKALSRQLDIQCHNISLAIPLCDISTSMIEKLVDARLELDKSDEKLTNFLSWKDSKEGKDANLPRIQESHKEILFSEWESQLMKVERATSRCRATTNNLVELINNNLHISNLITDYSPGKLPKVKLLEQHWKQELTQREKLIVGIQILTWETLWFFLVKPHNQQMAMKCLSDAINYMVSELSDATYTAQLHSRMSRSPEIQPMLAICQLQPQEKKKPIQ